MLSTDRKNDVDLIEIDREQAVVRLLYKEMFYE